MRHRVKKIKFKAGYDANKMLIKKLLLNFLKKGYIKTTLKKTKVLKSVIESIVEKAKEKKEPNKNYLLNYISDKEIIRFLFETVGPTLRKTVGGYVKILRLGKRDSDGSEMAKLEWAYPIVIEEPKKLEKKPENKMASKVNKKEKKNL